MADDADVGPDVDVDEVADSLLAGVGLLMRRVRRLPVEGGLSMPQRTALARLERRGPRSAAELAREEQISPQAMGTTLAALEARGMVARQPDPDDGRRVVLSVTGDGQQLLRTRRSTRIQHLARALTTEFTAAELHRLESALPLLQRLAQRI